MASFSEKKAEFDNGTGMGGVVSTSLVPVDGKYISNIKIPKFPKNVVDDIVRCYSNENVIRFGINDEILNSNNWKEAGIVQLDKEIHILKSKINEIIENVLDDKDIQTN